MTTDPFDETPTRLFAQSGEDGAWHVVWVGTYDPAEQTYRTLCGAGAGGRLLPSRLTPILSQDQLCQKCQDRLELDREF